jgi:hypothetical protein
VKASSYPDLDAYDVPTNQKAIEIRPWDEAEPFKITSLGDLEPNTDYHFDNAPFLRFRTANGPDVHVPSKPVQLHPSIAIRNPFGADRYDTQTTIALWGDPGDDAFFFEVFIEGSDGKKAHFGMRAWNPQLCGQPLRLSPGPAKITVWAVDRAGQRSAEPWTGDVTITGVDYDPTGGECAMREHRHRHGCGMGLALLFILVVPVVFIGLLVGMFIVSLIRRSRIRNTPGEPLSPLFGEAVARVVAKRYLIKSAIAIIVAIASLQIRDEGLSILASIVSWPFAFGWLVMLERSRIIVSRFEAPLNVLERREDWLLVDRKLLYCGRSAFNRASQVPTASVTKRS